MAQLLESLMNSYNELMSKSDQRIKDWPLMSGPLPTILICATYVLVVKKLGKFYLIFSQYTIQNCF